MFAVFKVGYSFFGFKVLIDTDQGQIRKCRLGIFNPVVAGKMIIILKHLTI